MRFKKREAGGWLEVGSRTTVLLLLCGFAAGCGGGDAQADGQATDTLTRRQKDSLISTMPIPGAGVVGKALEAADSASARAQRHDTLIK